MTEEAFKKLEALRAAAPPGPWALEIVDPLQLKYGETHYHRAPDRIVNGDESIFINDSGEYSTMEACEFVVAAHAAVPELIAEIRRLRASIDPVTPKEP